MLEKQTRLMLVLAALLLAVVGALLLLDPPEADEDGVPRWTRAFPDADATQIERLELVGPEGAVVLERGSAGWRIAAPLQVEADAETIQDALDALVHVDLGEAFAGRSPEDYGLDSPRVRLLATLESGQELRLDLGDDSPAGGGTYVRDAAGALRLSRSPLTSVLPAQPDAYRSRELLRFARSAVTGLILERPDGRITLEKDAHGWWIVEKSSRQRADGDRVDQLLEALANLRVERFADAPLALDAPWIFEVNSGDNEQQRLILGQSSDSMRPALGPLQDQPVLLQARALLEAVGPPDALLSRDLLPFRGATVSQLELRLGAAEFAATRTASGWDPPGAEAVIQALQDVAADRQQRDLPAPEAAAWGRIGLVESDGRSEAVLLYQELPGGRLAQEEAGGAPFFLSSTALGQIAVALPAGG